ncbi:unnamed protein product, partial [Ceratitis capitata]
LTQSTTTTTTTLVLLWQKSEDFPTIKSISLAIMKMHSAAAKHTESLHAPNQRCRSVNDNHPARSKDFTSGACTIDEIL